MHIVHQYDKFMEASHTDRCDFVSRLKQLNRVEQVYKIGFFFFSLELKLNKFFFLI